MDLIKKFKTDYVKKTGVRTCVDADDLANIMSTIESLQKLSPTDTIVLTPVRVKEVSFYTVDGVEQHRIEDSHWCCQVESRKYAKNGVDFGCISTLIKVSKSEIEEFYGEE